MMVESQWGHFFKPEIRNKGEDIAKQDLIRVSQLSDTELQAFIKESTPAKVILKAPTVSSETFSVDCSCSSSKKGQLCKHIWAALLKAEENHSDFLDGKRNLDKAAQVGKPSQSGYQEKQAQYKKAQYEKQKDRAKQQRLEKKQAKRKTSRLEPQLPEEIQEAVHYFSENGFPFEAPFDEEALKNAKKKLARIFHPDIGGSHDEIVVLNRNYEILISYIEAQ